MASFAHFVKANPVDGLKTGDRGDKRQEYLVKFMVFTSRDAVSSNKKNGGAPLVGHGKDGHGNWSRKSKALGRFRQTGISPGYVDRIKGSKTHRVLRAA